MSLHTPAQTGVLERAVSGRPRVFGVSAKLDATRETATSCRAVALRGEEGGGPRCVIQNNHFIGKSRISRARRRGRGV